MKVLAFVSLIILDFAVGIPLHMFYPYGPTNGDARLPAVDDGSSSEIYINTAFNFFGNSHRSLFVNTNGDVTFLSPLITYSPAAFPYQQNTKIIAPYWGDVDTRNGGDIWFRETHDSGLLQRSSTEIQSVFPEQTEFNATWIFIITWSNVAFYGADRHGKHRRCTFQCVLVTNGIHSFVMFNYYKMQWTTGDASGGDSSTGLGGIPAQVGFDAGDGEHYYAVQGSRTSDIINVPQKSNIGIAGKFIFRVDMVTVEQATLINECDNQICQNEGTCEDLDGLSRWRCNCLPGFTGIHCETDINECASSPCQHSGKCLDLLNAYRCHCRNGFTGNSCQIDINECGSNPCMHGATCRDKANHYLCDCQSGYIGDICQIDIDECQSNPCYNNASCIDKTPGWDCACLPGYTGIRCQTEIDECQSNPCENNGTCVDLVDGYECLCTNESSGLHCEKWMNHCSSSTCLHDGMCINQYGGFICKCLESWYGERCEFREINRTQICTDLEYTECSCFTHQLKPKPKSNKLLIGSIGSIIGLFMTLIFYTTWMLLNTPNNKSNRVDPEKTKLFPDNQTMKNEKISELIDKNKSPVGSDMRQKKHHNCFTDHSGFDFSKLYVNKDGSKRIIKCRHQRDA
ncbi:Protein eyes shut homolog,Fibropellin-3,Protein crumbs homolog 2,Protein crumbs homolog 1,Neurogenic locus Notch protein,Neurogenic locus notch homolog protein 3,Alpha-tectorin,Delta and Notch-like epidermal growth factor-related receptor,Neurogenic locus notch homolog protein 4,Delta-like protein C,Fibropellin-1,Neurogenic locus notch homolog protein 2,Protein crumbs,Protein jagged-1b,Protein jagged-2,Sushi, von Willebrand factor type A, EGF and pentraxin domain-containing protein 1,Neurogenic locus notch|uniref:Sushi, nidogen and EGF-like domain-containing protein 1,Alpha-tectorin n=1 Tax=Mytilus coruscus TaxID=42192 RepID=A0A6J8E5A6_MYTCO|nr:Protein eyes shut homolog,Fibropellin-3,Protein crumbs homolog 2,Protein crumbs homolog 1,Neurogenic locus Notch protein,Neurogenic locus notch homolog protein 3,Alpha-tectorin,Delta and Notch-like epidermal growth factor-related receptor,Neurogenic locus notch homolog protein 4,Delta-like protein C,Fibropellin-1,Neurogenic locus notch homolog protein 2,Protein crumbs,Protein jagged-1b,Protein jagged-2,Sushi, von Willebrand factor type A, EGF and pentraxin domain-containing protein 1,Neurogenic 